VGKSRWGPGPWQKELDEDYWLDEYCDLPCKIIRHPGLGSLCGYVGVSPRHPWHGLKKRFDLWNETEEDPEFPGGFEALGIEAHGGITYAEIESDGLLWLGFDCAHGWDLVPVMEASRRRFDPSGSTKGTYRDWAYAKNEVARLAEQAHKAWPLIQRLAVAGREQT